MGGPDGKLLSHLEWPNISGVAQPGGGGGACPALAGPILILSLKIYISFLNPKEVAVYVQYLSHVNNFNSFAGKANYYSTHVVQNKCCALQENAVSKQLALHA